MKNYNVLYLFQSKSKKAKNKTKTKVNTHTHRKTTLQKQGRKTQSAKNNIKHTDDMIYISIGFYPQLFTHFTNKQNKTKLPQQSKKINSGH
jgi:hypothetical protein